MTTRSLLQWVFLSVTQVWEEACGVEQWHLTWPHLVIRSPGLHDALAAKNGCCSPRIKPPTCFSQSAQSQRPGCFSSPGLEAKHEAWGREKTRLRSHADLFTTSPAENSSLASVFGSSDLTVHLSSTLPLSTSCSPETLKPAERVHKSVSKSGQVRSDWREVRTYIGAGAFDLGRMKIGILVPSVAVMLCSKWSVSYTLCHLILIVTQSRKRGLEC